MRGDSRLGLAMLGREKAEQQQDQSDVLHIPSAVLCAPSEETLGCTAKSASYYAAFPIAIKLQTRTERTGDPVCLVSLLTMPEVCLKWSETSSGLCGESVWKS